MNIQNIHRTCRKAVNLFLPRSVRRLLNLEHSQHPDDERQAADSRRSQNTNHHAWKEISQVLEDDDGHG